MKLAIGLSGLASFLMAFLGGVLAFGQVNAPQVTAQSSPPSEVRASAVVLVGEDGTVLAPPAPWASATQGPPESRAPYCGPGEAPGWLPELQTLADLLGPIMGTATECTHQDPSSGVWFQASSTNPFPYANAYYDPRGQVANFSDGVDSWALYLECGVLHSSHLAWAPRPEGMPRGGCDDPVGLGDGAPD